MGQIFSHSHHPESQTRSLGYPVPSENERPTKLRFQFQLGRGRVRSPARYPFSEAVNLKTHPNDFKSDEVRPPAKFKRHVIHVRSLERLVGEEGPPNQSNSERHLRDLAPVEYEAIIAREYRESRRDTGHITRAYHCAPYSPRRPKSGRRAERFQRAEEMEVVADFQRYRQSHIV